MVPDQSPQVTPAETAFPCPALALTLTPCHSAQLPALLPGDRPLALLPDVAETPDAAPPSARHTPAAAKCTLALVVHERSNQGLGGGGLGSGESDGAAVANGAACVPV